jgi:O-antigen ligase
LQQNEFADKSVNTSTIYLRVKNKYFVGISFLFVISLFYSRFMVTFSMIALTLLAISVAQTRSSFSFRSFIKDKAFSGLILVFLAIFLSGINSEDHLQWLLQVKLKLPFLFLPVVFFIFKHSVDKKFHAWIHYVFIATAFFSTFQVIGTFLLDTESILSGLGKGKSIPTPLDHIHYSIMVSYALVSAVILAILDTNKYRQLALFFISAYLFAFLHLLSVRTGLVLAYAGIVLVLIWFVFTRKKYVIGLVISALLLLIPFLSYKTIAPFKKKINYMFWDLAQYKKGKGNSYSDSERLMSYAISFDLIKERPFFGHGVGDLRPIMTEKHKKKYGDKDKYIYPHNQYLFILTCMGFIGALLFFYGLLSPLIYARKINVFLLSVFVLMLISFLVENTIQRAVITGFFLFFILLNVCLNYDHLERNSDSSFI